MDKIRQIIIEGVAMPLEPLFGEQTSGPWAWRAARTDPPGRALAGRADEEIDGSADVGSLLIFSEIDRNHVHGIGMRHDVVTCIGYLAHNFGVPLRHDA